MKKDEKRAGLRYPYTSPMIYTCLGNNSLPPDRSENRAEIMDLSDSGMKMRIAEKLLEEGKMLRVRIPVADIQATVPTLAEVIWMKKQEPKAYHVGLKFVVQ